MRNGIAVDYDWRKYAWSELAELWTILDPCWGKTYHGKPDKLNRTEFAGVEGEWRFCELWTPNDRVIYKQDKSDVRSCDAGVWNISALCDGYPCIGSITEITWAAMWDKLVYLIYPYPEKLHPFLKGPATEVFSTPEDAVHYLVNYSGKLKGIPYDAWVTDTGV
jgi:hypothetical protein